MAATTMAIVACVPGAFGRRLAQLQRRIEGEGRGRMPPHIPLLGPFEAGPPFLPLEQHCWEVCHRAAPFTVDLAPPAVDEERRLLSCEVVSGDEQLVELRQALLAGKYAPPADGDAYQPRCVIARVERPDDLAPARQEVAEAAPSAASCLVERIELMARYPSGEWYERDFYTLDAAAARA
ncbi:MAG: 2'-5' RNA ligase family protein [Dehalococcoidia bacterium]